jgi:Imidazolonepropionase and related amidohydrolases
MSTLIAAKRVMPCKDSAVLENAFVEIVDERIARVGLVKELSPEEQARCVQFDDCTILPGFINAHEHLATKTRLTPGIFNDIKVEPIQLQMLRAAKNARGLLEEGITTIRECGSREHMNLYISRGIKKGFISGPDVLACGHPISITGGHCYYYSWQVNCPTDVVKAARTELLAGADFIKVHATGGAGTLEGSPLYAELSVEELKAAVREAHRVGKRVVSHAIGRPGIENTLLAGVDSLEHGHYLDEPLLEMMVKQGTYYTPTLTGYVPLAEHGLEMGRPSWMVEKAKRLVDQHRLAIEKVRRYPEIVVAAGTDSSGEMVEEMELLAAYGFSPMEAILCATRNAAVVLGIEARTGVLEAGKQADMVIVKGNPLDKLANLRNVVEVVKKGTAVKDKLTCKANN